MRRLRPGRFCGTMRSACAVRNLSYSSLVYTPRKVKDGKEIIRTISAPGDPQGAQSLCRIARSTSRIFPNPRSPSCAAPVAAAFRPPSSLSLSGLCSAGLSPVCGAWFPRPGCLYRGSRPFLPGHVFRVPVAFTGKPGIFLLFALHPLVPQALPNPHPRTPRKIRPHP